MAYFMIKIYELNSRKKKKIIDIKHFPNRQEAEEFINNYKAELKPNVMKKDKLYYTMS